MTAGRSPSYPEGWLRWKLTLILRSAIAAYAITQRDSDPIAMNQHHVLALPEFALGWSLAVKALAELVQPLRSTRIPARPGEQLDGLDLPPSWVRNVTWLFPHPAI